jgi:hypothetical protein
LPRRSSGFQVYPSLKITEEEDETIIPMKDVTPNPIGIVKS